MINVCLATIIARTSFHIPFGMYYMFLVRLFAPPLSNMELEYYGYQAVSSDGSDGTMSYDNYNINNINLNRNNNEKKESIHSYYDKINQNSNIAVKNGGNGHHNNHNNNINVDTNNHGHHNQVRLHDQNGNSISPMMLNAIHKVSPDPSKDKPVIHIFQDPNSNKPPQIVVQNPEKLQSLSDVGNKNNNPSKQNIVEVKTRGGQCNRCNAIGSGASNKGYPDQLKFRLKKHVSDLLDAELTTVEGDDDKITGKIDKVYYDLLFDAIDVFPKDGNVSYNEYVNIVNALTNHGLLEQEMHDMFFLSDEDQNKKIDRDHEWPLLMSRVLPRDQIVQVIHNHQQKQGN